MQVYSQEILRIASGFTKETFANYNTDDEVKGKIMILRRFFLDTVAATEPLYDSDSLLRNCNAKLSASLGKLSI